jgi:SAM-dependent methyltransferase
MEELKQCPNCGGKDFKPFLNCIDYTVSKESFSIVSCINCALNFTNPRPGEDSIGKYYESDDYISHSNTNEGLINKIYHLVKKRAINQKIRIIEDLKPQSKKILDIGCGTGAFIAEISKSDWYVAGIEPNQKAREFAIKNYSVNVFEENKIAELKNESFTIITMWHVLEHVHRLNSRIQEIYNILETGGYAIIAVPNYTSWDAKHYNEFWAAYDVPRHLYHFSPDVIKKTFGKKNMIHIKSLPMKMDSFYVSMLSEKYKNSSFQMIKAFMNGLISNITAKNDPEKYSSVIYIFQKK